MSFKMLLVDLLLMVSSCFLCNQQLKADWWFRLETGSLCTSDAFSGSTSLLACNTWLCIVIQVNFHIVLFLTSPFYHPPVLCKGFILSIYGVSWLCAQRSERLSLLPPAYLILALICFILFIPLLFQFQAFTILLQFLYIMLCNAKAYKQTYKYHTSFQSYGDLDANCSALGRVT